MAKTDAVAKALDELKAVAADLKSDAAVKAIGRAVGGKSNLVIAKAADLIRQGRIEAFVPQLIAAFDRMIPEGKSADAGCVAKKAVASALYELEADAESVFLRGIRHVQMEGTWGGNTDTAGELRGVCALGLVRCHYRDVLDELAVLLVDREPAARLTAARAIAYSENEAGGPLLRMKLLAGDASADVVGECFISLLKLTPRKGVAFIAERFLDGVDDDLTQSALVALGASRQPAAFDLMSTRFDGELLGERKKRYLLPIALTRLPQAVEFLIRVIADEHRSVAAAALEAMKVLPADEKLIGRVAGEVEKREDVELTRTFAAAFGVTKR